MRSLEKFINSNVSYIKDKNFELKEFTQRVERSYQTLKKVEAIRLDATYPIALEKYANEIINVLNLEEIEDESELQETLMHKANLLHKEKNKTRYKKDKHKKNSFYDGY